MPKWDRSNGWMGLRWDDLRCRCRISFRFFRSNSHTLPPLRNKSLNIYARTFKDTFKLMTKKNSHIWNYLQKENWHNNKHVTTTRPIEPLNSKIARELGNPMSMIVQQTVRWYFWNKRNYQLTHLYRVAKCVCEESFMSAVSFSSITDWRLPIVDHSH